MRPSLEYVKEKFLYFNKLCFNNELPMPLIKLSTRSRSLGITRYRQIRTAEGKIANTNFSIEISLRSDLPEEEYINTIVHEMIHYYIAYHNIVDTSIHGEVFHKIMNHIISTYGIIVSVEYNPDDEVLINTLSRPRFVCVVEFHNGTTGLAVVAKNKVFSIWEDMKHQKGINNVKWYVSNRDIFRKFPVVVSPSVVVMDADIIHHYLTGASELHKDGKTITIKPENA